MIAEVPGSEGSGAAWHERRGIWICGSRPLWSQREDRHSQNISRGEASRSRCRADTNSETESRGELRVLHGGELIESRLSRVGEAPLLLTADQLKANLMEQG